MMYEWSVVANVNVKNEVTGEITVETVFFRTIGETKEKALMNAISTLRLEMGYLSGKVLELKKVGVL